MEIEFVLFILADIALTIYFIYRFKKYQEQKAMDYFMNMDEDRDDVDANDKSEKKS
ncbi:MAG: hypothetical protein HRT41_04920 [Campylobacteraceae bacterium]|nr:hypothetical protein [Campylobacteraceae bacterium]